MAILSRDALQIQDFYSADIAQFPKSVGVSPNTSGMIRSLKNTTLERVYKELGLFSLEN